VVISLRFKLRAILIETLLALTQKALKNTYATGVVMTVQEDGTIKENMSLNQPANRGFVKNFKLILSMQRRVAPYARI
jgi:hypothetical protein